MDLFRMQCFVAVSRHLNMSRAAQELFITQPSMSQQMSTLEDELGITLFIRSKKGLVLTEAGAYVAQKFEEILSQYGNLKSDLQVMRNSSYGKIILGFHGASDWVDLSGFLKVFREAHPNIGVDLMFDTWRNLKDRLQSQTIDAAFIEASELEGESDLDSKVLLHDGFCVTVPKSHRLAQKASVKAEELMGETIIFPDFSISPVLMDRIVREGKKYHLVGEDRIQGNYYVAINILVNAGYGIAVLPKCLCESSPEIVSIPLEVNTPVNIALAWHKASIRPATRQFIDAACAHRWE